MKKPEPSLPRSLFLCCLFLAAAAARAGADATPAETGTPGSVDTVVVLVRHAEPDYPPGEDHPRNPMLNQVGLDRAQALRQTVETVGITNIFSTDLYRTLQTAKPLAETLGLEVELYDPSALQEFAERLRSIPGRHLVSGHSNTTPELVELLGGEPGPPIVTAKEFDRMYVLVLRPGEPVTTVQLRYGQPSER